MSEARADNSVALGTSSLADRANTVSVGAVNNRDGSSFTRQIVNVAAGTQDNDAVNVGQMNTALSKKVDDTFIQVKSGSYATNAPAAAGNGATAIGANASAMGMSAIALGGNTVASQTDAIAIGTLSSATGNSSIAIGISAKVAGAGSIALGRVSAATADGASALGNGASATHSNSVALGNQSSTTRDNSVSVGSAALQRQITNLAAGEADTDAVNVRQMNAGLSTTNAAIAATNTALSTTNATLSTTNASLSTTNATLSTANTQIASLQGDMTAAKTGISTNTSDITKLNDKLGELSSGTIGLVQQANAGDDLTVGANTDGAAVNFASNTSDRRLTGVADGTLDSDAVNVGQMNTGLSTTNAAIAATNTALSTTNSSLSTTNATLSTANTQIASLQGDMTAAKTGISTNTSDITKLNDKLGELSNGTIGLVQQANAGDDLTVGANTDGAAVNFASNTTNRRLTGVADGTLDSDAVNVSQMNAGLSTTNASIAATNAALSTTNTQVATLDGDMTIAKGNIATHTTEIKSINDQLSELSGGTIGLVQQSASGADLTVGANTDGAAVNFAGNTSNRRLTGVADGTLDSDAVNVGQMNAGLATTNAAIAATNAALSTTNTQVAALDGDMTIAKSNIATHTTEIKSINDQLSELSGGTIGLVQQSAAGADLTVGANTDGAAVNFASNTSNRRLAGVADGMLDSDAVNVGQMNAGFATTNAAISGLDGRVTTNETAITNLDGRMTTSETTLTNIDNRVTANEGSITSLDNRVTVNEGAITKLADQIGSGSLGLVQQANTGDDLTVGANTDGAAVNFASKTSDRKLSGVAAGTLDSDAVNLGQMNAEFTKTNDAIAGLDGRVTDNETAITHLDGRTTSNETAITAIDGRVTNIDNRVTVNEGALTKLADQIGSGSVGLVQQDASGAITVAAATGGKSVNFGGSGGARVLSGVANGVDDDDVVTVSQLRATGLIDYTGKEVGAVTYDTGLNFDTVTFAGTFGTKLQRVAAGEISATSMDAINGSQLFDLQEQFAKQYGDLSGQLGDLSSRFGDLSDRLGDLEANPGTGGPGTGDGSTVVGEGAVASGENSSAIGDSALASGENASAVGQGAVASGNNGSAIGQGSVASGDNGSALGQGAVASGENGTALGQSSAASGSNSSAVGQGAVASGENSTSLGQGASATGSGSVAIGQGSVATEANTVSFGNGTEEGNRRLVNIADGINASDAATKGQLDRAMESVDARFNDTNRAINDVAKNAYAGIAAAMAMPNMTPSAPGKTVVAVGTANFKSGSAIAAGATYRSRNGKWLVNGAASLTSVGDAGVRAQVGYEF
ncbi:TPA: YadA-like family protein [Burkholderia cenocepacia]|nr:YadA-like family protein [Burkholderia cenocepacia]